MISLKRDLEKQKESVSAAEMKIKWNQNKLKVEQDAHKVCRATSALVLKSVREYICKNHITVALYINYFITQPV